MDPHTTSLNAPKARDVAQKASRSALKLAIVKGYDSRIATPTNANNPVPRKQRRVSSLRLILLPVHHRI